MKAVTMDAAPAPKIPAPFRRPSSLLRARYLGPGWDLAKVRGTCYNTGDGIDMALRAGASAAGNWTGCHAVAWDRNAPEFGDLAVGDGFQKHSYPFGIVVNAAGRRFLDEGADFRNYTYAKYGRKILEQPGQVAWQIFDQQTTHLLRNEYRIRQVSKVTAPTIEELAESIDGIDPSWLICLVPDFPVHEGVQECLLVWVDRGWEGLLGPVDRDRRRPQHT